MTEQEFIKKILPLSVMVYPMAKRLLNNNDAARDAVQQSMLKLWESRKQLSECTNVKSYVFRVVRNTCLDDIKRKKPVLVDDYLFVKQIESAIYCDHENKEALVLVKKIIEELPESQRDVIQMRDIDDLEFDEIAEILTLDVTYVRVLLSRARKTVREKLVKIYAYEAIKQ